MVLSNLCYAAEGLREFGPTLMRSSELADVHVPVRYGTMHIADVRHRSIRMVGSKLIVREFEFDKYLICVTFFHITQRSEGRGLKHRDRVSRPACKRSKTSKALLKQTAAWE
jgi:hypothetical protein